MLKFSTKLDFLFTRSLFTFSKQSPLISQSTQAYTQQIYEKGIYMLSQDSQVQEKQISKRQLRKRSTSQRKASKKNQDNDDENRGGGLLEPIIEDWKQWVSRRRNQPQVLA